MIIKEKLIEHQFLENCNTTNAIISLDGTNITESSAEFDAAERITTMTCVQALSASTNDGRQTNNVSFAYSEISGLTSQVTNETSGIFVEYDFDIMDQLKSLVWKDSSGSVIKSFDYSYSNSGMITNITREISDEDTAYTYSDFFGTLDTSSSSYYTAQYVTDAVGNPFEYIINGSYLHGFEFDAGNRLSSWMGGGYKYNIAGCVTNKISSGNSTDINWNDSYQITDVSINGSPAKSYTYDALGRRSSITDFSGNVTKIIYDGMHMAADVDEDNNLIRTYTAGPGIDNWLSFTDHQTSNTYYYITDHLGNVHAVTDDSGNVVESYRYSPYGKVLAIFDENGNTISKTQIGNRILFQGREYDWDTGFYYFRARWYDPDTGRWLSKDPIGINGGLNQYVFCGNNPVMFRDPLGLCEGIKDNPTGKGEIIGSNEISFYYFGGGAYGYQTVKFDNGDVVTYSYWALGAGLRGPGVTAHKGKIRYAYNKNDYTRWFLNVSGGIEIIGGSASISPGGGAEAFTYGLSSAGLSGTVQYYWLPKNPHMIKKNINSTKLILHLLLPAGMSGIIK